MGLSLSVALVVALLLCEKYLGDVPAKRFIAMNKDTFTSNAAMF